MRVGNPGKWSSEKWSPGNPETKNRGVGVEHRSVCGMLGCNQSMKTEKLDNKPKTRKQTQNTETKMWNVRM